MTERPFRLLDMVAATAVVAGVAVMAFPGHALNIVQLGLVTVPVVGALYALAIHVPPTGWMFPFRWMSPFADPTGEDRAGAEIGDELHAIEATFSDWRQPMPSGPPLPPSTIRLLRPLLRAVLELSPEDPDRLEGARSALSPVAWGILASDLVPGPGWYHRRPPRREDVARTVRFVLEEIENLADLSLERSNGEHD